MFTNRKGMKEREEEEEEESLAFAKLMILTSFVSSRGYPKLLS
jgi:hypothetical protein